ncbi:hypothetical protein P3T76_011107 [Phytophthora citrophthora]|uniref:Uncharacterized protein n=1 Tax=Phytophthora citrophthora TaxID=4793 RepID=A0AAD9G9T6_9STRA|nr:hypothetical protein P3T76_011107 [Phytophthora citrophthora]
MGDAAMPSASVFNLYQEGLGPDQVLQLCFLRRHILRNPQLDNTSIENDFVLPRPELKISSFLPSLGIPLQHLIGNDSAPPQQNGSAAASSRSDSALDMVRKSAREHFLHPRQAVLDDVRQWSVLEESDWLQILQHHKAQSGQDEGVTELLSAAQMPDIADVCWLLEHFPSVAFVSFVWDHLLLSLLLHSVSSLHQHLYTLLVSHHSLSSLSPKDFRAKVRARNLRQVDDVLGAQGELTLISLYQRQRTQKC